jgi:hypothetical protein
LPDPSIYEALRIAQPLTPIRGSGTPENHWRHFERMHGWPMGFIVTGDAVCAFNPIYGQGMTVSAMDAMKRSLLRYLNLLLGFYILLSVRMIDLVPGFVV